MQVFPISKRYICLLSLTLLISGQINCIAQTEAGPATEPEEPVQRSAVSAPETGERLLPDPESHSFLQEQAELNRIRLKPKAALAWRQRAEELSRIKFKSQEPQETSFCKAFSASHQDCLQALSIACSNAGLTVETAGQSAELLAQSVGKNPLRLIFLIWQDKKERTWVISGPERFYGAAEKQAAKQVLDELSSVLSKRGSI